MILKLELIPIRDDPEKEKLGLANRGRMHLQMQNAEELRPEQISEFLKASYGSSSAAKPGPNGMRGRSGFWSHKSMPARAGNSAVEAAIEMRQAKKKLRADFNREFPEFQLHDLEHAVDDRGSTGFRLTNYQQEARRRELHAPGLRRY